MPSVAIVDLQLVQHFFSTFLGVENSENFALFFDFFGTSKILIFWSPDQLSDFLAKPAKSRNLEILAILARYVWWYLDGQNLEIFEILPKSRDFVDF